MEAVMDIDRQVLGGPHFRIDWEDPETLTKGYVVIERLIYGIGGGGIRMRPGVTMEEVEGLARTMSLKKGIMKAVGGGAKGGIDCDPASPEASRVLRNFVRSFAPLFASCWSTGEDLGVRGSELGAIFKELGLGYVNQATLNRTPDPQEALKRMAVAMSATVDGVDLNENVGGYGVAEVVATAAREKGWQLDDLTVAVQGFGSMGGAAARYLARMGARVVGVADLAGLVFNPDGLDIESLFQSRSERGDIARDALRPGDERRPGDDWLTLDVDVLIPAAIGNAITEDNCGEVQARLIAEAANLGTTPAARAALHDREVVVIPDIIANSGTSGWWTWVAFGEVEPEAEASFARVQQVMDANVRRLLELVDKKSMTPYDAAVQVAVENLQEMIATYGDRSPNMTTLLPLGLAT